ncbi:acid phosphatase 1 [Fagus crenata]
MIRAMVKRIREVFIYLFLALFCKANGVTSSWRGSLRHDHEDESYCLSWRLAVEVNNMRAWRTVPTQCREYIETYMIRGQYYHDLDFIINQISSYADEIAISGDGMDAWILDVDDTCISNIIYYQGKRYGCDPYDPQGFKAWAIKGGCPAIPAMLGLFKRLVQSGFKVILLTGRDEETLCQATTNNLHNQGFVGYQRLIMRTSANKGQKAVTFKSEIRQQLVEEGYRIWGNIGDQWSDLEGDFPGNRTFKLPNPMYFVP